MTCLTRRRLLAGSMLASAAWGCSRRADLPANPDALAARAARAAAVAGQLPGGWVGADLSRGHRMRDMGGSAANWSQAAGRESIDVLVVGGGVAGLATLRALARAGVTDAKLIELEDAAGGNARARELGGIDCPLGAHYLPVPDERNAALLDFLGEAGLWGWRDGRRTWSERHLCHSPQERVFAAGHWLDGLVPAVDTDPTLRAALRRMAALVTEAGQQAEFRIPTRLAAWSPALDALDHLTFDAWLDARQVTHPMLRGYLDYCCRDDYGAASARVSAWAGLHYFASRRGFAAGDDDAETDPVLTWPEGNAWLATRLAAPRQAQIETGAVALAVRAGRDAVEVLTWSARTDQVRVIRARQVVLALPLFVARRLLDRAPPELAAAVEAMAWAPWLVSNLLLEAPLADAPGAAPAWDNVIAGSPALGYVDATHQALDPRPGPTVLTHYWALGGRDGAEATIARARLSRDDWRDWARQVLIDLASAQPDLLDKVRRIELMRYGHGMSVPVPGVRASAALAALATAPAGSRVHFAHADLSGYSVFEEAFFHGERAAADVVRGLSVTTAA